MESINKKSNLWIVIPKRNKNCKLRLFCFPFAGGGALAYRSWYKDLPSEVELCIVQLPGRENRINEKSFSEIQLLIDELVKQLKDYLDKPFVLFGHSMGGLISFEFTRRIRDTLGILPERLFLSAFCAPQVRDDSKNISNLPDDVFMEKVRAFNGIPDVLWNDKEWIQFILPKLKADFCIIDGYKYYEDEPLECPISAFCGTDDQSVSKEDMEALKIHTKGEFLLRMFEGGHFFINDSYVSVLSTLTEDLQKVIKKL